MFPESVSGSGRNMHDIVASAEKIREALNSLNFTRVFFGGSIYFIKTKATELAHKILRILKIGPPKNITPVSELTL